MMPHNKKIMFPSLVTERIQLRILTMSDTETVFQHFSDEEVTRFMDIEPCQALREAEEIIRFHLEDTGCRWGLFDKANHHLIGTCGFHCLRQAHEGFIAEIGFDLSRRYWGYGFMYEALTAVMEYGFTTMGLTMIDATVEPANERSIRLMEELGFQREAELKDQLVYFYLKPERSDIGETTML